MKFSLQTTITVALLLLTCRPIQAQCYFHSTYPKVWERSAKYTLEVAQAMPDSLYHYRPSSDIFSFHGQILHITENLIFLSEKVTGKRVDIFGGKNKNEMGKTELVNCLQKALNHVQDLLLQLDVSVLGEEIEFGGQTMPKENILYLMRDHMAHHRGQAIVCLRMNNISPPRYVGW